MPLVRFQHQDFPREEYESVLDCLLRHQQRLPYACKAGMCQACLVKAVNNDASAESKKWVRKSLQARGYTLACQWVPAADKDVEVALPGAEAASVSVRIIALDRLNRQVIRLRLEPEEQGAMFHYYPGQHLTLISPEGVARSYSIANDFEQERFLELHIAATAKGLFSGWLFGEARQGDRLQVRGPAGDCFYLKEEAEDFPLLLAGTGTGLAPLYGIARDALRRGHRGPITLIHGARQAGRLYYVEELQALARDNASFRYLPVALEGAAGAAIEGLRQQPVEEAAEAVLDAAGLGQTHAYLCGAPDFVHGLRKRLFLKGLRSAHIHTDPFLDRAVDGANV